jgi:hypothetical protein
MALEWQHTRLVDTNNHDTIDTDKGNAEFNIVDHVGTMEETQLMTFRSPCMKPSPILLACQPPPTNQQYFSLTPNQHQPPATS